MNADPHNVHQFHGVSPALDLLELARTRPETDSATEKLAELSVSAQDGSNVKPRMILEAASADPRHTIYTMFQSGRHRVESDASSNRPVQIVIWEDNPEALGRHMLLTSILLDDRLPVRDRIETFLEVHGNVFVKEKTAVYVEERARQLEDLVLKANELGVSKKGDKEKEAPACIVLMGELYDLSQLKFQDRDLMAEYFRGCRRTDKYDMQKGWDARLRKWYGERYDFMRNMVDWDYHMRMQPFGMGVEGVAEDIGTIIHFYHFRAWRTTGLSYELRDSVYNEANRTLLSVATGRTQEFKDRSGNDRGRSVAARGFWADIINSPFHCFGVRTDAKDFYKQANKQFMRSSVDVAEYNLNALLHELRTGARYAAPSDLPVAPKAAGPTTEEDLASAGTKKKEGDEARKEGEASTSDAAPAEEGVVTAGAAAASSEEERRREVEAKVREARELEEKRDAFAREQLSGGKFKLVLLTGDVDKVLFGKKQFQQAFEVVSVGRGALHLLQKTRSLPALCVRPGAVLAIEGVRYMLETKKEQVAAFEENITGMVNEAGWTGPDKEVYQKWDGLTKAHLVFRL